jgi:hypothetical protein
MRGIRRFAAIALGAGLIAACSNKPAEEGSDIPLAFVPADTPFVYANLEPLPAAVTEQWSRRMQEYWPTLLGMYDDLLQKADARGDVQAQRWIRIARTLLDEIRTHDSWDKLRQIGFKPCTESAWCRCCAWNSAIRPHSRRKSRWSNRKPAKNSRSQRAVRRSTGNWATTNWLRPSRSKARIWSLR